MIGFVPTRDTTIREIQGMNLIILYSTVQYSTVQYSTVQYKQAVYSLSIHNTESVLRQQGVGGKEIREIE